MEVQKTILLALLLACGTARAGATESEDRRINHAN